MADTKNLCAQIPIDLHRQVREHQEESGKSLGEYMTWLITTFYQTEVEKRMSSTETRTVAFQVPAGVGMYWILSNLFMMGQTLILNKFYNPREMAEKAKREAEERREKERLERIEAKKKARSGDAQKEINRQKLAAARKADAEKYGDVYTDVTDDDLE